MEHNEIDNISRIAISSHLNLPLLKTFFKIYYFHFFKDFFVSACPTSLIRLQHGMDWANSTHNLQVIDHQKAVGLHHATLSNRREIHMTLACWEHYKFYKFYNFCPFFETLK